MSSATPKTLITLLIIVIIASTHGRVITFRNSCPFHIDVEKIKNGDHNIEQVCRGLGTGGTCNWEIPYNGWAGNFHRRNAEGGHTGFPSGTLAEFAFPDLSIPSQWNMDFFDISIIPPGCPGSITSYDGCWCNGGTDGYDVGMVMKPLRCPDKTRTCKGRYCDGAYLFPKDDSKTTACTDTNTDWEVEFCPPGSHIDLEGRGLTSQTPPCRGGPNPSPTGGQVPNPIPNPPSGGKCQNVAHGVDYYGSDISNRPAGNIEECCSHCSSVPGCGAWTLAYGVCYMKHASASSNRVANGNVVSGSTSPSVVTVRPPPPPPPSNPPPPPPPPPQQQNHCSQPCVRGGFAGTCTSNCPPCYIPSGNGGWNCFEKNGGACPAWGGMTDCSAGGRKVAAHGDESATFNNQNSSTAMGSNAIIGLSVGVVVLVVVLVVVVIIAVSKSKQSKVETV